MFVAVDSSSSYVRLYFAGFESGNEGSVEVDCFEMRAVVDEKAAECGGSDDDYDYYAQSQVARGCFPMIIVRYLQRARQFAHFVCGCGVGFDLDWDFDGDFHFDFDSMCVGFAGCNQESYADTLRLKSLVLNHYVWHKSQNQPLMC